MMLLLTNNRDQLDAVLKDRSLEQNAVEEALRLDAPVQGLFRTASEDVDVGGVRIPRERTSKSFMLRAIATRHDFPMPNASM
jgi:cytochrome P450